MTRLFIEQPLALPGSAKYYVPYLITIETEAIIDKVLEHIVKAENKA